MLPLLISWAPALALALSIIGFLLNGAWTILNLRMENRQSSKLDEFKDGQTAKLDEFKNWIEIRLDKMQVDIEQDQYKLERRVGRIERHLGFRVGEDGDLTTA